MVGTRCFGCLSGPPGLPVGFILLQYSVLLTVEPLSLLYLLVVLKPTANRSLFKLIISDQTLIKLKLLFFLPIYVHFNGQTFRGVFEQFSFTSNFRGLKVQK